MTTTLRRLSGARYESQIAAIEGGKDLHRLVPMPLSEVGPEPPVSCVITDVVLAADITGIFGDGDAGKSTLIYLIVCCVVLGVPLFGRFLVARAGRVLIVTSGEDRAPLVRNRCLAILREMGISESDAVTALAKLDVIDGVSRDHHPQHLVNLDDTADLLELQRVILAGDYRLVTFDPVGDLIGDDADTLKDRDVRRIYRHVRTYLLAPCPDLGVIVTGHATKDQREKTKRQRVFGAAAWTNGLRACWFIEKTDDGFMMDASAKGNRWAKRPCHRIIRTVTTEPDGTTWRAASLTLDTAKDHVSNDVATVLRIVQEAAEAPSSRDLEALVKGAGMGADRAGLAIGQAKSKGWITSPPEGRAKAWTITETGRAHLALQVVS